MLLWLGFIICTATIVYSGTRLSRYGDIIAEKTGLGKMWIGMMLIATVTSLPELVTGISSVTFSDVPDIAVGDVLGSCVFNLLIITFIDSSYRSMPIFSKAHHGNVLSACCGILLLCTVSASLFLGRHLSPLGWIGPYSVIFIILYVITIKLVYSYEKRRMSTVVKEKAIFLKYEKIPIRDALRNYGINAFFVIIAAAFLPKIGQGIAQSTGLGQTFVGNIFIAFSTSIPEVVVSFSAIKIDAIDLAIGNLFGSNLFNIMILSIDDILLFKGPLLLYANPTHIISASTAIAMTTVTIIGLTYRSKKKLFLLSWESIGIILLYLMNILLLYKLR